MAIGSPDGFVPSRDLDREPALPVDYRCTNDILRRSSKDVLISTLRPLLPGSDGYQVALRSCRIGAQSWPGSGGLC